MQARRFIDTFSGDRLIFVAANRSYIALTRALFPDISVDIIGRDRSEYLAEYGLSKEGIELELPMYRQVIETGLPVDYETELPEWFYFKEDET